MTQQAKNILRESLNQIDRERNRSRAMLYLLLAMTGVFWAAMMFAKDDHVGMPYGLAAVISSVFVAGMIAAKTSNDNTRAILKAIELISRQGSSE